MSLEIASASGAPAPSRMADEVRRGLRARPRTLPSKYFYDDAGSALFERITELPEYYPTRTEQAILERVAGELVASLDVVEVAELGAGSSRKTRVLLDAMAGSRRLRRIALLDVNEGMLAASQQSLASLYRVDVATVAGDFVDDVDRLGPGGRRLLLFLGSTIGNLAPEEARVFLRRVASVLDRSDAFLVGFDLVKDVATLEAAYNDAEGVTAEFNRNILHVVNAGLDGDFDPAAFDHVAFFDRERSWIEMRLRARRACRVSLRAAGLDLRFRRGEDIRTEISCKYTRGSVEALVAGSGLALVDWHTDADGLFALGVLRRAAA